MLFSPLNMRQPRKMMPNKRQQKARLSNIMFAIFSLLGLIIFFVGFKLRPPKLVPVHHPKSQLPAFARPQPHLLPSHATVAQVDAYINATQSSLGSMNYQESTSCKEKKTCEIHFPYLDLDFMSNHNVDLSQTTNSRTDYAVLTRKGFKALVTNVNANQDRAFVLAPLEMGKESSLPIGPDDFLMGLFDGHGPMGHGTSHFAAMEFPPLLLRNMQRRKRFTGQRATDGIKMALKDSFIHLDENIPFLETSGSTGILILRIGMHLFLANTGDSLAFVVQADLSSDEEEGAEEGEAISIVQSTVPHKPDSPLEKARILSAGGQVIPKMSDDTSSRVVIPVNGGEEGMTLALAMSRSLGDPEGKTSNVVIADPTVDIIDLEKLNNSKSKFFLVVASDGLLDKIPPLEVAQRIAQSFYQEEPPQPLAACQELILQASQMWMLEETVGYRDDISIAVKMIDL